jgi:hypothetical protein
MGLNKLIGNIVLLNIIKSSNFYFKIKLNWYPINFHQY